MTELTILMVGCDAETEDRIARRLRRDGVRLRGGVAPSEAATAVAKADPDVVLLDVADDPDAAEHRVALIKHAHPEVPLLVIADDVQDVATGTRGAVFDVLTRPLDLTRVDLAVTNAARMRRLMRQVNRLQGAGGPRGGFHGVLGESPAMRRLVESVESVSRTDVSVVITGESGTGKSRVARALHEASERRGGSFVTLQAAAVPEELIESELFGHEPGAFPGADVPHDGCVQRADGGTLFIAELCDVPLDAQRGLLQFLPGGSSVRAGSAARRRVVAATSRDAREAVRKGVLREELYYLVNVVTLDVPPLRARTGDVALLAQHFLGHYAAKYGRIFQSIAPDVLAALDRHAWPGNVRELENVIERIVVLHDGPVVTARMLPQEVLRAAPGVELARDPDEILPFTEIERREIVRALRICEGNVSRAAERLQIGQATLYRKVKKYGLQLRRGVREVVSKQTGD